MHKFHIWKSTKFNAISMKAKRQAKYKSSILPVSCFAISDCNRQGFYGVKSYKVDYNCKNKVQPNFEFLFFRHFINLFFFVFVFLWKITSNEKKIHRQSVYYFVAIILLDSL